MLERTRSLAMHLSRRTFLAVGAAICAGGVAAQGGRTWRIGFLAQIARPDPFGPHIFGTLSRALAQLGYVEGRNLAMEWRFANGDVPALPRLAAELAAQKLDVVVTAGPLSAVAMRRATTTMPVVFGNVPDPVGAGLVQSFSRSGTNMTGVANLSGTMMPKLMELALEAVPRASRLALLVNPQQPSHAGMPAALAAQAARRQVRLTAYPAAWPRDIDAAFETMARDGAELALIPLEGLFIQQRSQIGALGLRHGLPTVGLDEELSGHGALLTYGADQHVMFRKVAGFVDRVLRGTPPQDLPVEQASEYVLVINRSVESPLRLQVPPALLIRADRVI
jgi:putative ABC transport system substrate-binding protein